MPAVFITGGSAGIGFEMARSFSKRGCSVLINGVNEGRLLFAKESLEKEFGRPVIALVQDLSAPDGARALYNQVGRLGPQVEILINNAGLALQTFSAGNVPARERKNTECGLGCRLSAGPYNSTYFASKSFVPSYSCAIRYEARNRGVRVCTLCPGSTGTQFFSKEGAAVPPTAHSPEKVAEYACNGLMRNRPVIILGVTYKASRLIPSGMKIALIAKMKDLSKNELCAARPADALPAVLSVYKARRK